MLIVCTHSSTGDEFIKQAGVRDIDQKDELGVPSYRQKD